jgi:hypothetical protein
LKDVEREGAPLATGERSCRLKYHPAPIIPAATKSEDIALALSMQKMYEWKYLHFDIINSCPLTILSPLHN